MPEQKCEKPIKDGNPNFMLKDIKINDQTISGFNHDKDQYALTVDAGNETIKISAQAIDKGAIVSGTGNINLYPGMNIIQVKCTAENGNEKVYKLNITRPY